MSVMTHRSFSAGASRQSLMAAINEEHAVSDFPYREGEASPQLV
jgi:hypothetical protein